MVTEQVPQRRGSGASRVFLVAILAAAAAYLVLPLGPVQTATGYITIEVAAAAAILIGTRGASRPRRRAWSVVALALLAWAVGDVFWWADDIRGVARFPAPADGLYLAGYVGLGYGLLALARPRPPGHAPGELLDALLVWVGVAVPAWLLWVGPALGDPGTGRPGQLVGSAYALLVLALVLLLARFVLRGIAGAGDRQLLTAAVVVLLLTNLLYAGELYQEMYEAGGLLDLGWLVTFGLLGAAGLHPGALAPPAPADGAAPRRSRITILWVAASIPPLILLGHVVLDGRSTEVLLVAGLGTLAALGLFALRVWRLVRVVEATTRGEGERRLSRLVERIHDVIAIHGPDGRLRYLSPSAAQVWGHAPDDVSELVPDLVHPDDRGGVDAWLRALAADAPGQAARCSARIRAADGSWWMTELTGVNLLDDPVVQGVVVTYHDVSEQAAYEEQLRRSADEQARLVEQLRDANQAKDVFLSAASHDLRTPLTAVRGMAELLAARGDDLAPALRDRFADRIAVNAKRIERLLSDLVDLDRLAGGAGRPRRVEVDVATRVRRLAAQGTYRGRPITCPDGPVVARVDPTILERIVDNLLANATKYTPPGTAIDVRLEPRSCGGVTLVVTDQGPGIAEQDRERILEAFTRLESSEHVAGSGIGLSLVERFAHLHGGRVTVDAGPDGGARFTVELAGRDPAGSSAGRAGHDPGDLA